MIVREMAYPIWLWMMVCLKKRANSVGCAPKSQFEALRDSLVAFEDVAMSRQVYESAAQAFNTCRANGVQGSNTDFLICAVSIHHQLPIFSMDGDFLMYRRWLPIHLYAP